MNCFGPINTSLVLRLDFQTLGPNSNKGCPITICQGPNSKGKRCNTFCWKKGYSKFPLSSPSVTTTPSFPAPSQAFWIPPCHIFKITVVPTFHYCTSAFIASAITGFQVHCIFPCHTTSYRRKCCFCCKHCITKGGCGSRTHTSALSSSTPTCPNPILAQLSSSCPASPSLTQPPLSMTGAGDVPLFPAVPSPSPTFDPQSLDAWPNPRFNSHMPSDVPVID
ncbi:uncharacterized protein LACBIDRAFT_328467 [Laccaria bicolor S238N-H82]|uniref:Predicted protein n=1 Tax=Laccaria bicolor (strain S238N-H82 / ATCC MYA-4686) TaxID=486041 RepID=B0DEX7_LACBS|nr:uncharacterized protein LACBIDRAFT_328467 [Laccaria bicolor S238N-H82]EDR06624.1 predicted protein [Laccaria bicolor S238N-H82]|eukprot:XP_001882471.1 predicted protein [Laccaria bicolor S238N-H82]